MHQFIAIIAQYLIIVPVIVLVFIIWRPGRTERLKLLALLVVSSILTILAVKLATTLYSDPRPFISDGVKPYFQSSTDNGFPSDHAAASTLVALVVLRFSRRLGLLLLLVTLLIGTARVIAGVHHTQDILGGLAIAAIGYYIATLLLKRLAPAPA